MAKKLRFIGKNGEFVPTIPRKDNETISIGYLEELCEYVFYHNNKTNEEKLKEILELEKIIERLLSKMKIKYKPSWSVKAKNFFKDAKKS